MTPSSYASSLFPRNRRSQRRLTTRSARHTCSRVSSGFSPPQPLRPLGDESHRYQAQAQVPHQRRVVPPLEVREAQLRLGHPKAVLHLPAPEADTNQRLHGSIFRGVGQEELLLAGLVVAGPDQPVAARRPALRAVQPHPRRLDPPDLLRQCLPGQAHDPPALPAEDAGTTDHALGAAAVHRRAGAVALAVARQARERARHLAHEAQLPRVQAAEEAGALAILLIEGQPVQVQAVARGPVDLPQGDLPLGPVDHLLGDTRPAAAGPAVGPGLGQEQVGVDQALVTAAADAEVDGDDAVIDLADTAEVLPLHARGLGALFQGAGLVDQPDGAQLIGRVDGGEPLGGVLLLQLPDAVAVPVVVLEELLQGADGGAGLQGDGLDALGRQVGEHAADVGAEGGEGLRGAAAEDEAVEVVSQGRAQGAQLVLSHGTYSPGDGEDLQYHYRSNSIRP